MDHFCPGIFFLSVTELHSETQKEKGKRHLFKVIAKLLKGIFTMHYTEACFLAKLAQSSLVHSSQSLHTGVQTLGIQPDSKHHPSDYLQNKYACILIASKLQPLSIQRAKLNLKIALGYHR